MKESAITHYEVYCLEERRWILHARFRREERERAIEEAKTVERNLGATVKVVREIYYPGTNTCDEAVVYGSSRAFERVAPQAATATRRRTGAGGNAGYATTGGRSEMPHFDLAHLDPTTRPGGAQVPKTMGLLVKMMLIVVTAIAVAGVLTGLVSSFGPKLASAGLVTSQEKMSAVLFAVFVFTFLVTAIPMAMAFLREDLGSLGGGPSRPAPKPMPKAPPKPVVEKPAPAPLPELPPIEVDEGGEKDVPPPPAEEEAAPKDDVAEQQAEKPEPEPPKDEARPPQLEVHRLEMMKFLGGIVQVIKGVRPQLDAYNKFGIDLMLAGGVELFGERNDLEAEARRDLLCETIQVMGTKPTMARSFAEKYETYMMEPRYLPMVRAGRDAMEDFLDGHPESHASIPSAIEAWNRPQAAGGGTAKILTVIFTDMVGSTDMTQERGDWGAQDIVRRHNSIVRSALAQYGGKEIKHTGDGIMASFPSTADGVEACIQIQRDVARHNRTSPDLPLHLRIGINAGEPIQEEDDLFGSTVQLSARVCAKCDTDKILCTNIVRELAQGRPLSFSSIGAHALKGFKDPITLYEVDWQEPATVAPTGAPAQSTPVAGDR